MHAIKQARRYIQADPTEASAQILAQLILALESEAVFPISDIYRLDLERFSLAIQIMAEWRLDRFYAGKAKLFDTALVASGMNTQATSGSGEK